MKVKSMKVINFTTLSTKVTPARDVKLESYKANQFIYAKNERSGNTFNMNLAVFGT